MNEYFVCDFFGAQVIDDLSITIITYENGFWGLINFGHGEPSHFKQ